MVEGRLARMDAGRRFAATSARVAAKMLRVVCALSLASCGRARHDVGSNGGEGGQAAIAQCELSSNPQLELEVRRRLSLGAADTIDAQQLSAITSLAVDGLATLIGIECLANLEQLRLTKATISDFGPLSALKVLVELQIDDSSTPDLSTAVAPFEGLQSLEITGSNFRALSSLATLRSLTRVNLSDNALSSLEGLSPLPLLEKLVLDGNELSDLSPLSSQTALEELSVDANRLTSLSSLNGHPSLRSVSAGRNAITTLADLDQPALSALIVSSNQLSRLGELSGVSLLRLTLSNNLLKDASGIESQHALSELALDGNPLASVTMLAGLSNLRTLSLADTEVSDLTPLADLDGVRLLDLKGSKVTDLMPLRPWSIIDGNCRQVDVTDLALDALSVSSAVALLCHANWQIISVCPGACFGR
jgi:internalin A